MNWTDLTEHLTGLCHLATADAHGQPHVAIVSTVVEDATIWAQARRSTRFVRDIVDNAAVALMWTPANEAYVWGTAEVTDDVATKERLWSSWGYDANGFFGSASDPDVVLLRVTPGSATLMGTIDGVAGAHRWRA